MRAEGGRSSAKLRCEVEEALNSARRRKMPGVTRVLQRAVEEAQAMRGRGTGESKASSLLRKWPVVQGRDQNSATSRSS